MAFLSDKKALNSELELIGPFVDADVGIKYTELKPAVTEGEKLDNLKKRKDLGLNRQVELIRMDDPDLSVEDAELKLKEINEEKMARAQQFTNTFMGEKNGLPETDEPKTKQTNKTSEEEIEINGG